MSKPARSKGENTLDYRAGFGIILYSSKSSMKIYFFNNSSV